MISTLLKQQPRRDISVAVMNLQFYQSRPAFLKPMRFQFEILKLIKQVGFVPDVILACFEKELHFRFLQ